MRDAPAVVLVEDMHWFDEDTAEVVHSLLDADLGEHVLIVMTSREPVQADSSRAEIFELRPLTGDDADELIMALHPEVSADERAAVRHRCDGVPLYIEEVVAKLREQPSDQFTSAGVPDTLYEALFARLQASPNALPVVEAAAIIGSRVERSILLSVVDLDEDALDSVIGDLVAGPGARTPRPRQLAVPSRTAARARRRTVAAQPAPSAAQPHRRRAGFRRR